MHEWLLNFRRWNVMRKLNRIAAGLTRARKVRGGALGRQTFLILQRRDLRRQLRDLTSH